MSTLSTTNIKHPSSASNNVVLDSSGRALIGTSSARTNFSDSRLYTISQIEYAENDKQTALSITANSGTSNTQLTGATLALSRSNGTAVGSNTLVTSGARLGTVSYRGADGSNLHAAATIEAFVDGTPGANDMPGRLVFSTTSDGSDSPTERMRLDSSGNLQFNSGYGSVATAYGCRAWVNFNGTSTVAIRGSGNVSSITDNGTGQYTVNFATAMPDANHAPVISINGLAEFDPSVDSITSSSFQIAIYDSGAYRDRSVVCAAVFR